MEFAVITDAYDWHVMRASATPEAPVWVPSNPGGIPTPEQLVEFELIVVVGSLSETGTALQLAGVVKLAMERGKGTCVFAHPPHLSEHDAHFVEAMGLPIPYGNRADHVKRYPDEFHAYFTEYGMSGSAYNSTDTAEAIRLGWIYDNEGMLEPAALCWETETRGVIYTVPYNVAKSGNPARMVGALREAVTAHRDTLSAGLPGYLSDVRIGEVELESVKFASSSFRSSSASPTEAGVLETETSKTGASETKTEPTAGRALTTVERVTSKFRFIPPHQRQGFRASGGRLAGSTSIRLHPAHRTIGGFGSDTPASLVRATARSRGYTGAHGLRRGLAPHAYSTPKRSKSGPRNHAEAISAATRETA